jgi:hypothetical protein
MEEKFVSFEPVHFGYTNIRMAYEIAAAIAFITNRTLILPPNIYCLFFTKNYKKSSFIDMWATLDKDAIKREFKCVDFSEVPEYKALESENRYLGRLDTIAKVITFGDIYNPEEYQLGPGLEYRYNQDILWTKNAVITNNITDIEDFNIFSGNRNITNVNLPDKFIHFPRNLFGHFWYHVYGDGPHQRNTIKEKIKNGVKYKDEFFQIAKIAKEKLGKYNALHIRRNDFLRDRADAAVPQVLNLVKDINSRISKDMPLYIATDEKDKTIFNLARKSYDIRFLSDLNLNLNEQAALVVEQLICSEAETFLGSKHSTYTEYINVLRGYNNKKDTHREGTNFNYGYPKYNRFPWETAPYSWDRVFESPWTKENIN